MADTNHLKLLFCFFLILSATFGVDSTKTDRRLRTTNTYLCTLAVAFTN